MINVKTNVTYSNDNFAVGNIGPIFLVHWKKETTIEALTKCNQLFLDMVEEFTLMSA